MKKYKVISTVPIKLPVNSTVLYSFLLYYFKVDGIYIGIFISVFAIYWAFMLYIVLWAQESVNPFEEKTANEQGKMVTFAEKLKEKAAK